MSDAADRTVEVTFGLRDSDFFLVAASEAEDCELTLEFLVPRSDELVLEFLSLRGADPEPVMDVFRNTPHITEAHLLDHTGDEAVFELIADSRLARTLADEEAVVTGITAQSGDGRLVAEIPPHIDAEAAIRAFLDEYPGSELIARRETDRSAPALTQAQFVGELLEALTEKQLRALRVAHASGYFEWPRDVQAADVADRIGVSTPTFSEHLRAAERKVFALVFAGRSR